MQYFQRMSRVRYLAWEYWFELLIGALAVAALLELIIGRNSPGAPSTSLRYAVPAVVLLVAPLFARRRFPFAAPAAYWLIATAIALVDGLLIPFMVSLFPVGLAAAFLLGNLRDARRAWAGLAIVLVCITTIVYNIPGYLTAELILIPVDFGIAWVAGFILRETAVREAEAAEERATHAEREREAAARVAVAEERSRIARELHDIVAHAVSVMVLQVGAIQQQRPAVLEEDKDALRGVEQAGRRALAEMRRLLAAMRPEEDEAELVASAWPRRTRLADRGDQPRRPAGGTSRRR